MKASDLVPPPKGIGKDQLTWLEEIGRAPDPAARTKLLNSRRKWVTKSFCLKAYQALYIYDAKEVAARRLAAEGLSVVAERVGDAESRARALDLLSLFAWRTGRHEEVAPLTERSSALWIEIGNYTKAGQTLGSAAKSFRDSGHPGKAAPYHERAAAHFEQAREPDLQNEALFDAGVAYREAGQHEASLAALQKALARSHKDSMHRAIITRAMGMTLVAMERLAKALTAFQEAAEGFAAAKATVEVANCHDQAGHALLHVGRHRDAIPELEQAVQGYESAGRELTVAETRVNLGSVYLETDQHDKAIACLEKALPILERENGNPFLAYCLHNLGSAYKGACRMDEALMCYERAQGLYARAKNPNEALSLLHASFILSRRGRYQEAVERCRRAIPLLETTGHKLALAEAWLGMGYCADQLGQYQEAISASEQAVALFKGLNSQADAGTALVNLGGSLVRAGRVRDGIEVLEQAGPYVETSEDTALSVALLDNQSIAHAALGSQDKALEIRLAALALEENRGDRVSVARHHLALHGIYRSTGLTEQAKLSLERVKAVAAETDDRKLKVELLIAEGAGYLKESRRHEAMAIYQQLEGLLADVGEADHQKILARLQQARIHVFWGQTDRAIALCRENLDRLEGTGNAEHSANNLSILAEALAADGRPVEAREAREQALRILESQGSSKYLPFALTDLAESDIATGDVNAAVARLERALTLAGSSGDREVHADVTRHVGHLLTKMGRHESALSLLTEARSEFERLEQPVPAAFCDVSSAWLYQSLGMITEAMSLAEKCRTFFEETGHRYGLARTLELLSVLYRPTQPGKALKYMERVRGIHRELGNVREAARNTGTIGLIHVDLGQHAEALAYFEEARRALQDPPDHYELAWCDMGIARLLRDQKRYAEAVTYLERARPIFERIGQRNHLAWTYSRAAEIYRLMGDRVRARENYLQALAIAEQILWQVSDPEMASQAGSDLTGVPIALATLALEEGNARAAFDYAQRGKGLAVRHALTARTDATLDLRPEDAKRLRHLRTARDKAEMTLSVRYAARTQGGPSPALVAQATTGRVPEPAPDLKNLEEALAARDRAVAELSAFEATLSARSPRWARREARPATLAQVARALGSDTAVLEVVADDARVYLMLVRSRKGQPHLAVRKVLVTKPELGRSVDRLLKELKEDPHRSQASLSALITLSRRLYSWLIAPLEKELTGIETLIVCPDGVLHSLPFAALQDAKGRYLIERFAITNAPSASAWEACRTLSKGPKETASPPLIAAVSQFGDRPRLIASLAPASARRGSSLSDLPHVKAEADLVRKALGSNAVLLVDEAATFEAVTSGAEKARLLHFATHAFPNDAVPLQSALMLAPSPERPLGLLYARDIYGMRLSAELAVLSACSTGEGRVTGEGLLGLSWAFLVAGCPRTVASRWDVDDRATRRWMEAFYNAYEGERKGVAESVRQAALALIRTKGTPQDDSSPHHWAAWTLIGNDR